MKYFMYIMVAVLLTSVLFACSTEEVTTEGNTNEADGVNNEAVEVEANEDQGGIDLSQLSKEELLDYFLLAVNEGDVDIITANVYEGQEESITEGIYELNAELQALEIMMEVEKVFGEISLEEYSLVLLINRIVDNDGNVLNYTIGQIPFMNVDGGYQYAWDFAILPEHISSQEAYVNEQLLNLINNDQHVQESLEWMNQQNQIHQAAFDQHMQAHQEALRQHQDAVNQQNQMTQQQQQQQQQMQQQQNQMMNQP